MYKRLGYNVLIHVYWFEEWLGGKKYHFTAVTLKMQNKKLCDESSAGIPIV